MPETYTSAEAARVLGVTTGRIRQLLRDGVLEGAREGGNVAGERGRWHISRASVHAYRDARKEAEPPVADLGTGAAPEIIEAAERWSDQMSTLSRELGRLEGQLQITETAESTLREQLDRERERADRLEAELQEARQDRRGWLRRFFGF